MVDHIDYAVGKVGIDHVGIASDFNGGGGIAGWSDASGSEAQAAIRYTKVSRAGRRIRAARPRPEFMGNINYSIGFKIEARALRARPQPWAMH